jgi:hypothetical protein
VRCFRSRQLGSSMPRTSVESRPCSWTPQSAAKINSTMHDYCCCITLVRPNMAILLGRAQTWRHEGHGRLWRSGNQMTLRENMKAAKSLATLQGTFRHTAGLVVLVVAGPVQLVGVTLLPADEIRPRITVWPPTTPRIFAFVLVRGKSIRYVSDRGW